MSRRREPRPDDAQTDVSLEVTTRGDSVSFRVRATPRARASAVAGISDGVLTVRVAAPPVEGRANEVLRGFLADLLGVRAAAVQISSGDRSRHKVVEVRGIRSEDVRRALRGAGSDLAEDEMKR